MIRCKSRKERRVQRCLPVYASECQWLICLQPHVKLSTHFVVRAGASPSCMWQCSSRCRTWLGRALFEESIQCLSQILCCVLWMQLHGEVPCAKLNSVIHAIGMLSLAPDFAAPGPLDESRELATPRIPTSLVGCPICPLSQSSLASCLIT